MTDAKATDIDLQMQDPGLGELGIEQPFAILRLDLTELYLR